MLAAMENPAQEHHLDPQICRQCRGLCCRSHPGCWSDPERFFRIFFAGRRLTLDALRPQLAPLGLQLRDYSGVPVPAPAAGEDGCQSLGESGCRYPTEQRPDQCLALVPDLDTLLDGEIRCRLHPGHGYGEIRDRWLAYWRSRKDLEGS